MNLRNAGLAVAAVVILGAPSASAQERSAWISGQAGFTSVSSSSLVFAGEAGKRLSPALGIYGSFGRMADSSPRAAKEAFELASAQTGVDVSMSMPTLFGIGGIKAFAPLGSVKPYGIAGLGFARVSARYKANGADVTDQVSAMGGGFEDSGRVLEFGGGVEFSGPVLVDVGYRLMRLGEDHNVSRIHAAVGVAF